MRGVDRDGGDVDLRARVLGLELLGHLAELLALVAPRPDVDRAGGLAGRDRRELSPSSRRTRRRQGPARRVRDRGRRTHHWTASPCAHTRSSRGSPARSAASADAAGSIVDAPQQQLGGDAAEPRPSAGGRWSVRVRRTARAGCRRTRLRQCPGRGSGRAGRAPGRRRCATSSEAHTSAVGVEVVERRARAFAAPALVERGPRRAGGAGTSRARCASWNPCQRSSASGDEPGSPTKAR